MSLTWICCKTWYRPILEVLLGQAKRPEKIFQYVRGQDVVLQGVAEKGFALVIDEPGHAHHPRQVMHDGITVKPLRQSFLQRRKVLQRQAGAEPVDVVSVWA